MPRSFIGGLFNMKCPQCREGDVFVQKNILPLKSCLRMTDQCNVCGLKMVKEHNNGPGINYALTIIIFFLNLLWYWPIFGLSYKDYSIYYYLITTTLVVLMLQPWLMRFSRMLYLYMSVRYRGS